MALTVAGAWSYRGYVSGGRCGRVARSATAYPADVAVEYGRGALRREIDGRVAWCWEGGWDGSS
jgi:hypothetical protein